MKISTMYIIGSVVCLGMVVLNVMTQDGFTGILFGVIFGGLLGHGAAMAYLLRKRGE